VACSDTTKFIALGEEQVSRGKRGKVRIPASGAFTSYNVRAITGQGRIKFIRRWLHDRSTSCNFFRLCRRCLLGAPDAATRMKFGKSRPRHPRGHQSGVARSFLSLEEARNVKKKHEEKICHVSATFRRAFSKRPLLATEIPSFQLHS